MAEAKQAEARRAKRGVSLATTLAGSMGVLTCFAVGIVLYISWDAGRRNTYDLLNEKSISIVETVETGIRNHLDPAVAQLGFLGRLVDSGALHPNDVNASPPPCWARWPPRHRSPRCSTTTGTCRS